MTTSEIKQIISTQYASVIDMRLLHNGYSAKSYLVKTANKKLIAKHFDDSHKRLEESTAIKQLGSLQVRGICTPKILIETNDWLVTEYFTGLKLYDYLKFHEPRKALSDSLYQLGKFLAQFHQLHFIGKNEDNKPICIVHGDLNPKNILFAIDKIFIFDPWGKKASIYYDLAMFILIFYPLNPFLALRINRERESLVKAFIRGYIHNTKEKINPAFLFNEIYDKLKRQRDCYFSKKISYRAKKVLVNLYIYFLRVKLKNGNIQVRLHEWLSEQG